ncbi:hypothetical protein TWF730_007071 [Orbilia blumenaviensis]|uniref:Uncharacterized protein n=1 Tax=Orbilia blumenaviensis TaxID=1796055 RepID=A0AAV9VIF6_9PEZI
MPSFQSLILSDLQYPRHIGDVWSMLENSADTLKSLAIKTPEGSELERFITHRGYVKKPIALPRTELSLQKIQDLHIEGIPYLHKFLEECAPNLINFSNLRMLRLDSCESADRFLLSELSVYRMPKLKSLQLFETGSSLMFDGLLPHLGELKLETLVIALHRHEGRIGWGIIKRELSGSLKRLWIQHMSSASGPYRLLDMTNHHFPYCDTFFPNGWPNLEEVAIDTHYLEGDAVRTTFSHGN